MVVSRHEFRWRELKTYNTMPGSDQHRIQTRSEYVESFAKTASNSCALRLAAANAYCETATEKECKQLRETVGSDCDETYVTCEGGSVTTTTSAKGIVSVSIDDKPASQQKLKSLAASSSCGAMIVTATNAYCASENADIYTCNNLRQTVGKCKGVAGYFTCSN